MIFGWSGKPINHFQKHWNINIFQNKSHKNPHKFAEIEEKQGFWQVYSLGHPTVFLISKNLSFIMCGAFERKEIWFLRIEK